MTQTESSLETTEQELQEQPQPDPELARFIRTISDAIAAQARQEEVESSLRARSQPIPEEVAIPQPTRVRFNRD